MPFNVGLGLRRDNAEALLKTLPVEVDCLEIAPENYLGSGGKQYRHLCQLAEHYPIVFHGLSLSVGSLKDFDQDFLNDVKKLVRQFKAKWMSDHLCYSSIYGAQLHDLLPLPLTREAVLHVVPRIQQLQDFFEMPFAVENVSYYVHPGKAEMSEWDFVAEVTEKANCSLLLDINNVYVNSVNHHFDPYQYLEKVPWQRVIHLHIAGHKKVEDFLLDTHGAEIISPVWDLLRYASTKIENATLILERDNNVPELENQLKELRHARGILEPDHPARSAVKSQDPDINQAS